MNGKLWENFRIGRMELKNRVVMPPMVTRYAADDGFVTERTKNYYEARARGGFRAQAHETPERAFVVLSSITNQK